jgi:hypothetical protein
VAGGQAALAAAAQEASVHVVDTSDASILRSSNSASSSDDTAASEPLPDSTTEPGVEATSQRAGAGSRQGSTLSRRRNPVVMKRFIPHTQRVWTLDTLVAAHSAHHTQQAQQGMAPEPGSAYTVSHEGRSAEAQLQKSATSQLGEREQTAGRYDKRGGPLGKHSGVGTSAGADASATSSDGQPHGDTAQPGDATEQRRAVFNERGGPSQGLKRHHQRTRQALFKEL